SARRPASRCIAARAAASRSTTSSASEIVLKFHPLTLMERADCAEDAVSLSFAVPPQLRDVYRFEAGQHIAVRMGDGERRTYSIVSPQGDATLRIGVRLQ